MDTLIVDSNATAPAFDQVAAWLAASVAKAVKAEIAEIDHDVPFDRFGLDSVAAVEMTRDLSSWLGADFPPTLLYDYPTITQLSAYIMTEIQQASAR